MEIVIYVIAAVFALLAAALVFTWWRNRHSGALLLAMTYLVAAGLAVMMNEWWPLVLGFLSVVGAAPDGDGSGSDSRAPSR